ncbi:NMDA receptor-regulated protein 1a [Mycena latifolia]|nr:NMDA receptor-regulated protein 1a [Mycena latifolia]
METTCMKGLVLTHMGRREEGIELVRKGVRLDLTSHICWHVYGLIHKGEKNYEEALKCYTQALRFDKCVARNLNILRDAAQLQTQLRIYDGLVETRHTLLKIRPAMRQHGWHLPSQAKKVLEQYEATLKNVPDYDVEHSETMLYHVRLLEDLGEFTEALAMLDVNAKSRAIVDRTSIMEIRARLLSKLQSDEAEHAWRVLVEHNPDCYEYYRGYLSNLGLTLDATDARAPKALSILEEFSTQLPRATAPRRLALTIALVTPYLLSGLKKGVPSLFSDIKGLYQDQPKQQIIEEVAVDARDKMPVSLDGQDRFLNTKSAKYRLRAGMVEEASALLGLFTKKDAASPGADLEDMQSLSAPIAFLLRHCLMEAQVFDEVEDDQYDFHGYSLRNLLTWEDRLRSHPAYVKAALSASRVPSPQSNNDDKGLEPTPKDDDPDGSKLLQCTDPLERAAKLLKPLVTLADTNIEVWIATYDVAVRRKKYLQASKALAQAAAINSDHPELHVRRIEFRQTVSALSEPPQAVVPVLAELMSKLLPDEVASETFNSQYLQRHSTSAPAILAAARVQVKLRRRGSKSRNGVYGHGAEVPLDIKTALAILAFLDTIKSPREAEFRAWCSAKFPLATVFKPAAELAALRELALAAPQEGSDKVEDIP